ncbi:MAG: 1-deoxy-D-xylulose-5-phosphate synthase [Opitutaceae bacterium]|nr:1-deoxy-D-xylulose-5-phosphate synthase [Verrucomicrobiales bacterium]
MYIERKAGALTGEARIGRVTFNKTGRTIFYREQVFRRIVGGGFKSNYCEEATGENYWISGPKRRGGDRMYGSALPVDIDGDVRAEYWHDIRGMPERLNDHVA